MPAPPARSRSARVPCGLNSTSSAPVRYCRSYSWFSPTYEPVCRRIRRASSRTPSPSPSTPQLLLTVSRLVAPCSNSASISTDGTPHRPNPPIAIDAPSKTSATASLADGTTLSTRPPLSNGKLRALSQSYASIELRLDEDHQGLRQHAVVRHRLAHRGVVLHRLHHDVQVCDVHQDSDLGRVLRIDERADVRDAERSEHLFTLGRGEPVVLVLDVVV